MRPFSNQSFRPFLVSCLLVALNGAAGWIAPAAAATIDFSDGWLFHRGDIAGAEATTFDDSTWDRVTLPHTARLEALVTDQASHQQWEGLCWYRKTFALPAEALGQVVELRLEGAMNLAELFINGTKVADHADGYLPFVSDISAAARPSGPIVIAVRLDNRHSELTGPKPLPILDFHLYHGLYRAASLSIKPPLHLTDESLEDKVASGGIFVTYPKVTAESATVATQMHVRNSANQAATFALRTTLRDPEGRVVASREISGLRLERGEDHAFVSNLDVPAPRLWSPQSPHRYTLDVDLVADGKVIENRRERIGIRQIEAGLGGFTINGRKQFLRGVNRHQEYPYVGNAVPANAQFRDAWKIKQAGFDFVRLSHYPQSPAFMDACDELGLVVMPSILGWQFNPRTPEFERNRIAAARALIRRDRNHPCAILWEVALNETAMAPEFIVRLQAAAHEEYPGDQMLTAGWVDGYDVKMTARQHGSTKEFQTATFPCFVSEYGDWEYFAGNAGFNQDQWQNLGPAERSSRQVRGNGEVRLLQQATNVQEAHNDNRGTQAFGDAYWVMFDYNRGYATDLETSGVMDIFRRPKFAHAFFQSQRDPEDTLAPGAVGPMVFAATWWTEKSPLNVRVFSNADAVELFLNGRSVARQSPDQGPLSINLVHPPFTFHLARYEPGELKAIAYRHDQVIATHSVKTPRRAERIDVSIDESGRPLAAGGDLVFVHARIIDENGTTVPDATIPVIFRINGDAHLIGDNPITSEAGIASILVQTGKNAGPIEFNATAGTLAGHLEVVAR